MLFEIHSILCRRHHLEHWKVPVSKRAFWRLWWNNEEGASVLTEAGEVALGPSCFVLVAPYTEFSVSLRNTVDQVVVHYELGNQFLAVPGVHAVPALPRLVEVLNQASDAGEQGRRNRAMILSEIVSHVSRALPDEVWKESVRDPRIAKILAAMDTQLSDPIPNRVLAEMAHMTPTAFIRRFKQVMGRSPQSYYIQRRLNEACHLLETENQSIESIAESCGFCDRNYFSTAFRKHFGISPAAFRQASRHL